MSLENFFREQLAAGLRRKSITTCSRWAQQCRFMKGENGSAAPWSFKRYPWTREMHDSQAEFNVGRKSAQMAYTETVLNIGFYHNDIKGHDVLYVLPNKNPDAGDFSSARFDAALELSPHLASLYSDVQNVGHKRCGRANFYIRGSQSRAGLKSIPVSVVVIDELEEMDQANVPLAMERTSGQLEKLVWAISTPTLNNHGIDKLFLESSQEHFFFKCPHCSKATELTFRNFNDPECLEVIGDDPDSLKIMSSYYKCKECRHRLDHETKTDWLQDGFWVPSTEGKDKRGFYINQMYSTTIRPGHIAASFLRGRTNPADEQEFFNSKMGMPHEVDGARITNEMIEKCKSGHIQPASRNGNKLVTMGIDVGRFNHYEVVEWTLGAYIGNDIHTQSRPKVLEAGKVRHFDDLDELMHRYAVNSCVIDAHPERRESFKFSQRFSGYVKMCIYVRGMGGKQIQEEKSDIGEPLIKVDRTSWLDQSLGRFKAGTIALPSNIGHEYTEHLKAIVRVPEKDADGNPTNVYITEQNKGDHHAHARNYAEIALAFAASMCEPQDIID